MTSSAALVRSAHVPQRRALGYQPALDGLRAIAVGAVLVYHLGAPWLPGGFLGVDLFFVLSGFLITTLLVEEWRAQGRVDLGRFWLRRVRRLLPAALLVVTAVMAVGWRTVDPSQLGTLRADGLWTIFYGANWHLIGSGQSYFDAFAAPSPLRHAWSLAIEEQFYLVWPLLTLVVLRKLGLRGLGLVVAVLATVSAVLMAVRYNADDPSRAYYGTDTRVHELLIGAGAAILRLAGAVPFRGVPGRRIGTAFAAVAAAVPLRRAVARLSGAASGRRLTGAAGVAVLAAFVFMPDEWVGFYRGGAVAFAVVATVLVLGTIDHPARVLTLAPVVWVGRLSYGIYLWHWPVYCWVDDAGTTTGAVEVAIKVGGTLALAVASYYLVEQPIRRGKRFTGFRIAFAAPTAIAAVVAVTLASTGAATAPAPIEPRDVQTLSTPRVMVGPTPTTQLRLATVGDSVIKSLAPGLMKAAKERNWSYTDASVSSCSVEGMLMVETDGSPWSTGAICPEVVPTVQQRLLDEQQPDVILVHSRWETYRVRGTDGDPLTANTDAHKAFVAEQLRLTMARLTSGGARVVWIDTTPMSESLCRRLGHSDAECTRTANDAVVDAYTALRKSVADEFSGRVTALSLNDLLCDGDSCPDKIDGQTLRPDGLHFSPESSELVVPELLRRVASVTRLP
ncbi:acyltransferase family protein [Cryptosporangium sp. NPDC048952]|uniref:acyltransferase family protein n=1 Tax=Cryptosporangium sp. NPDC048952 TaxID=3363961 RepID=UPI00371745D8